MNAVSVRANDAKNAIQILYHLIHWMIFEIFLLCWIRKTLKPNIYKINVKWKLLFLLIRKLRETHHFCHLFAFDVIIVFIVIMSSSLFLFFFLFGILWVFLRYLTLFPFFTFKQIRVKENQFSQIQKISRDNTSRDTYSYVLCADWSVF
jgi:hypothetical protein